jgi:hypothetical protein
MLGSETRPAMARRPKNMSEPPSPLDEEKHIYPTVEHPLEGEIVSKYTKQALFTPNLSPRDWKNYIEDAIDTETDQLFQFLHDFSTASESPIQKPVGHEGWDGYAETASVAAVISSFLLSRQTKSVALGSPTFPSVVSVFDGGEGPCIVLNGLLSPRLTSPSHPYSQNDTTAPLSYPIPTPVDTGGTAAIVAAYAYLHSIQRHLIGTVVLSTISDTEEGHLGTLQHLLNTDERRMLWRGDCMITAATKFITSRTPLSCPEAFSSRPATGTIDPATFDLTSSCWQRNLPDKNFTTSRVVTRCATHPVATSLSNNGKRVLGRRPSMDFQTGRQIGSHSRFWTEVGISSFCLGVGEVESHTAQSTPQQISKKHLAGLRNEMLDTENQDSEREQRGAEQMEKRDRVAGEVDRKQWIQLVKVLVLTVWDQLGLEE